MRLITTLLALLFLGSTVIVAAAQDAGSAENPYTKNYVARAGVQGSTKQNEPKIFRGIDKEADYQRLLEDGFDMLGSSSFQDTVVPVQQLMEQEEKVGADIALVYSTALTRVPDALKMQQAKADAARKSEDEEQTNIDKDAPGMERLPLSQPFYDYYATYWVKLPPPVLGLHVQDHQIDKDKPGLPIVAVIKGSPAAAADLRKGDVVLKIGDVEAKSGAVLVQTVRANMGKTVEITVLREDLLIQKEVPLNAE
ncbi:MAG TPA: PDZ domain-containing protein [Methylophilaceae bacterium]